MIRIDEDGQNIDIIGDAAQVEICSGDMEKEHLFNEHGAPVDNHILADSVL